MGKACPNSPRIMQFNHQLNSKCCLMAETVGLIARASAATRSLNSFKILAGVAESYIVRTAFSLSVSVTAERASPRTAHTS